MPLGSTQRPPPHGARVVCFLPASAPVSDVKPRRVRLFIKPYCGWCHKAMRWLNDHGVDYQAVDVTADESAMAEMIRLSGDELVPVIEVEGKILADFGPEQLATFWESFEKSHGSA
jgi:glutaredoxin